ncbi:MAG TPA: FHA domain-containing protein [Synechococcus sp. M44_DOE_062]|nr:FHA domain-containing protein [Synechococcus sp. M44_DOE_062]
MVSSAHGGTHPGPVHWVLIFRDRLGQRAAVLEGIYYSVGRAKDNHIRLYDPCVSRKHASLVRVPGSEPTVQGSLQYSYIVFDGSSESGSSSNGLFVNGKRVLSHRLQLLDKIRFGPNVMAIVERTDRLSPETLAKLLQPPDAAGSGSLASLNGDTEPNPRKPARPEDFTTVA